MPIVRPGIGRLLRELPDGPMLVYQAATGPRAWEKIAGCDYRLGSRVLHKLQLRPAELIGYWIIHHPDL